MAGIHEEARPAGEFSERPFLSTSPIDGGGGEACRGARSGGGGEEIEILLRVGEAMTAMNTMTLSSGSALRFNLAVPPGWLAGGLFVEQQLFIDALIEQALLLLERDWQIAGVFCRVLQLEIGVLVIAQRPPAARKRRGFFGRTSCPFHLTGMGDGTPAWSSM